MCRKILSRYPYYPFRKEFRFAKGYNEALKQVVADYYVLLNSDVEVTPGWLEPMVSLLESDKAIAACQPKILSFHNKKKLNTQAQPVVG
ncbi:MAG: glycosyltransferase [Chitinophagaceae bacterium]